MMEYAIGVDIGGTKIQIAAVDAEGNIVQKILVPTEAKRGPKQVMDKVLEGIEHISAVMPPSDIAAGIGVGSAGQIDYRTGEVVFAGDTLPGWTGMPIKRQVEERFGKPAFVDNDVNVIAVAEKVFGAGRQYSSFICLALGTGVGGAVVESGQLVRGAFGGAGELGHVSVDFNGPLCGCGNNGCIELYASGTGIARMGREMLEAGGGEASWLPQSRDIIQAWLQGERMASELMDRVFRALGAAVAGFIHTFNPEAVIIGGGVSETGPVFFEELDKQVKNRTTPGMLKVCRLLPAYVGADAGVIGAAAQVWYYGNNR
jgi:glucokinase